jgi:hypothetical protein
LIVAGGAESDGNGGVTLERVVVGLMHLDIGPKLKLATRVRGLIVGDTQLEGGNCSTREWPKRPC